MPLYTWASTATTIPPRHPPLSSLHTLHHFHRPETRFKSEWRLPVLHWTNHLLWYKRISHILTVLSVDDKTSSRL